jgi:hypothetical protein
MRPVRIEDVINPDGYQHLRQRWRCTAVHVLHGSYPIVMQRHA